MINEELLIGEVQKILFVGDGNFTIAVIKAEDHYFDVTVKGVMHIEKGCKYEFRGQFKEDDRYGDFFAVINYNRPPIQGGEDVIAYLSSKTFTGIGKRTAKKIYDAFGEQTLDIIKENPNLLLDLGISQELVDELNDKHSSGDLLSDLYKIVKPFEFSDFLIQEIYKFLDEKIDGNKIKYFCENPFNLINKIYAFNYVKADAIFLHYGGNANDNKRVSCLIADIINNKCYQSGDTVIKHYIVENDFKRRGQDITNSFELCLNQAIKDQEIIEVDQNLATKEFYFAESGIANNITLRLTAIIRKLSDLEVSANLLKLEKEFNINYSSIQKMAIKNALDSNFSVITGGPGTGKTTIIRAIVNIFSDLKYKDVVVKDISEKIMLCAPTGRAAQRMKETTGFESRTIHSLLGWDPYTNNFARNLQAPLHHDLIVIDEFSMVDVFLANSLFKAIKPDCIVIIVGDKAQLESVAPGNVLADFLKVKEIPSVQLDLIYRQGEGSTIASLAKQIDANDKIELINTNDMSVFDRQGDLTNIVKTIYDKSLSVGYDQLQVQVLYPKYKGINGIDRLNEILKPKIMSDIVSLNGITFQIGDKVMQLKNDSDRDIYNGDIGFITKIINPNAKGSGVCIEISIREKKIEVTRSQMDDITHAYAISVHKSQGSEFSVIILPVTNESRNMLTKKLLYTAVTRTKDKLILLGNIDVFYSGIQEKDYLRNTLLDYYLNMNLIKKDKTPFDFL